MGISRMTLKNYLEKLYKDTDSMRRPSDILVVNYLVSLSTSTRLIVLHFETPCQVFTSLLGLCYNTTYISSRSAMPRAKSEHYVNNKEFLDALIEYRENVAIAASKDLPKPRITNYIGSCFLKDCYPSKL